LPVVRSFLALLASALVLVPAALASDSAARERGLVKVGDFVSPVYLDAPRSERGAIYVVEQGGRIVRVAGGRRTTFLDIRPRVLAGGEQGLLGLAFHPKFAQNRLFYIDYTARNGNTIIAEYRARGAKPTQTRMLMNLPDPAGNHNGGQLVFGPDKLLWWGNGDGGGGGDTYGNGQRASGYFAKIMRLNVDKRGARWQTWAVGLRNPWRFSFDRATGDLLIGDVGQGDVEEIDFTAKSSPGLENYGWDVFEGSRSFEAKALGPGRLVRPIAEYSHAEGCSVTGGYVYRGANKALRGRYVYGDYCSGTIWSFKLAGGTVTARRTESFKISNLTSFGEDGAGELYAVSGGGTISRLTP
jgi:glucose/arabinose dehydrogenase